MIIQNGTIECKSKTPGGINPLTGHAIPSSEAQWLSPIPCQWSVSNLSYVAESGSGERFTKASYVVLIEQVYDFSPRQVRLKDNSGNTLGEFSVISQEELDAVCQTKIII